MVRTFLALVIKYLMTFAFAWLAFVWIHQNPLGTVAFVALIAGAASYFLGDTLILPAFGNVIFYLAAAVTPDLTVDVRSLFGFGLLIGVGEYFFHKYLESSEKVEP